VAFIFKACNPGPLLKQRKYSYKNKIIDYETYDTQLKMDRISVLSCNESLGCNGVMNTSDTLQATRIGWAYYQIGKTGVPVVSRKYRWDDASKCELVSF